jgi:hypothetical protein
MSCRGPGGQPAAEGSLLGRPKGRKLSSEEQGLAQLCPIAPQPKQFRKMIQQTFQQYASLREEECVMKFFNTLAGFANIDQETYRCELIVMT